jgi:hypothetical protein
VLTIGAGDNFAAAVDAGTDVVVHIAGAEVTLSPESFDYRVYAQVALSTTAAALFTSPAAGKAAMLSHIKVTSEAAVSRVVTFFLDKGAAVFDATTQWGTPITLGPGESAEWTDAGWMLYDAQGTPRLALPPASGLDYLGGAKLIAPAVTTGAVQIPLRDMLYILVRIVGYSGGDIASFRFNGDAGANYWSRYISSVAGGVALVNNQNLSQTLARLFALTTTLSRSAMVSISNRSGTSKVGNVNAQTGTGAAGTAGILEFGGFEWVNTTAQITSVEMRTAGGAVTMNTDTGFMVFGKNL